MQSIDPTLIISGDESVAISLHGRRLFVFAIPVGTTEVHELSNGGRLVATDADTFAVLGDGPRRPITVRRFHRPGEIVASAELHGDSLKVARGAEHLDRLPSLVPLDVDSALLRDEGAFRLRRLRSPVPEWVNDLEAVPYVARCPDDRHVLVCGYKYDGELLFWDAQSGRIDQRMPLLTHGVGTGVFRPGRNELWVAQHDTVERIDTRTWTIVAAKRVRNEPTGSFIGAMAFDTTGRKLAVGHSLRRPRSMPGTGWPWYAPAGGQLLILDADSFSVTHILAADRWLDELAWLSDGRLVAREWGADGAFLILSPTPATHALHPPRRPGDRIWI